MQSLPLVPADDSLPASAGVPLAGAANEKRPSLIPAFYPRHLWMPLVPFALRFLLLAQQQRGAHFASHDLVALAIYWLVALALHRRVRRRQLAPAAAGAFA